MVGIELGIRRTRLRQALGPHVPSLRERYTSSVPPSTSTGRPTSMPSIASAVMRHKESVPSGGSSAHNSEVFKQVTGVDGYIFFKLLLICHNNCLPAFTSSLFPDVCVLQLQVLEWRAREFGMAVWSSRAVLERHSHGVLGHPLCLQHDSFNSILEVLLLSFCSDCWFGSFQATYDQSDSSTFRIYGPIYV
ncbi:hypothetical protein ZWY2020_056587 [Hordeum vulgare]|nr:hypothetical protein ZWY2020_056587 [Hordeum vulgare]